MPCKKKNTPGHPCHCFCLRTEVAESLDCEIEISGVVADTCGNSACADVNGTHLATLDSATYSTDVLYGFPTASLRWIATWTACDGLESDLTVLLGCGINNDGSPSFGITGICYDLGGTQNKGFRVLSGLGQIDKAGYMDFLEGTTVDLIETGYDGTANYCDWSSATMSVTLI